MEKNRDHFGFGLFLGIALGVLAGIVIAPSTGEETRSKILDSTDELQNNIRTISKKIKTETDELIKKGKNFVKEAENSAFVKIQNDEDFNNQDTGDVENEEG